MMLVIRCQMNRRTLVESFTVTTMIWLTVTVCRNHNAVHFPSPFMTYHRVCNKSNTTGANSGTGTAYPSGAHEFTLDFWWGSCYTMFSFLCRLFQIIVCPFVLFFFVWPLNCLSLDLRFLITPLVSSNFSKKDLLKTTHGKQSWFVKHFRQQKIRLKISMTKIWKWGSELDISPLP